MSGEFPLIFLIRAELSSLDLVFYTIWSFSQRPTHMYGGLFLSKETIPDLRVAVRLSMHALVSAVMSCLQRIK